MTEKRAALIIASAQYQDADLRQLIAPAQDAEALTRVLQDPTIGGFEVQILLNEPSGEVNKAVEGFFADRRRDDLLLLYFSGHGIKAEDGQLYFATANTRRKLLRSTSVAANFVNDVMRLSRSRRQVLLLDCCYSGAFAKGMVAKAGKDIGTGEHFEGRGRVVLTASDAMQYAFVGDEVEGQGVRSVFTRALVHGLETGEADLDGDGHISLEELYEYVHDRVVDETPQQRPERWDFGVQGKIIIARNPAPPGASLPGWIAEALASGAISARLAAVAELSQLSQGQGRDLVTLSRNELGRVSREDENPAVRGAAVGALGVSTIAAPPEPPRATIEKPALRPNVLTITSPIHLELVRVPAGEFLMGSDPVKDKLAFKDEQPQHRVHIPEFYISKTLLTNVQYAAFVKATGHQVPQHWKNGEVPFEKEDHPVVNVSWHETIAFCEWLSQETGENFRLPTEAEWEKSARGTDGRIYPWGNRRPTGKLCNLYGNIEIPAPVGWYSPQGDSPYGCVDMGGNVWEWTQSLYKGYPYDPADGREGLEIEGRRVVRGGSPALDRKVVPRCAYRTRSDPVDLHRYQGFRLVMVLSPLNSESAL